MKLNKYLKKLSQKADFQDPSEVGVVEPVENPSQGMPPTNTSNEMPSFPSIPSVEKPRVFPTAFNPWKKKQYGKWKVVGYFVNIEVSPENADVHKMLESSGWRFSTAKGPQFSKMVKTDDDVRLIQDEMAQISRKTNCEFDDGWIEGASEAFPLAFGSNAGEDSQKGYISEKDEAREDRVETILKSYNLDETKKKELTDKFVLGKIKELADLTDQASKDEFILRYLTYNEGFHNYSFVNRILMILQRRDVSPFVAGAKQWEHDDPKNPEKSFKRKVREGESPMNIFAPEQKMASVSMVKKILEGLINLQRVRREKEWKGDVGGLLKEIGIPINFYSMSYLGHILFFSTNIDSMIERIEEDIRRAGSWKNVFYGRKTTSDGRPVFKMVEVYDVSQTDPMGSDSFQEPEKDFWMSKDNKPDAVAWQLLQALIEWAKKDCQWRMGDKLQTGINNIDLAAKTGAAGGWSEGANIAISEMSDGWRQFSTTVHEVSHSILHFGSDRNAITSKQREIEAESTAFVVLNFFGYTDTRFASNYLALHKSTQQDVLDRYNRIDQAVGQIIRGIQKYLKTTTASSNWFKKVAYSEFLKPFIVI